VHQPNEEGATAVEYGLMTGLIAVVISGAVTTFGTGVLGLFQSLLTEMWPD
jgi:pilus assembly protein Flp/PilA